MLRHPGLGGAGHAEQQQRAVGGERRHRGLDQPAVADIFGRDRRAVGRLAAHQIGHDRRGDSAQPAGDGRCRRRRAPSARRHSSPRPASAAFRSWLRSLVVQRGVEPQHVEARVALQQPRAVRRSSASSRACARGDQAERVQFCGLIGRLCIVAFGAPPATSCRPARSADRRSALRVPPSLAPVSKPDSVRVQGGFGLSRALGGREPRRERHDEAGRHRARRWPWPRLATCASVPLATTRLISAVSAAGSTFQAQAAISSCGVMPSAPANDARSTLSSSALRRCPCAGVLGRSASMTRERRKQALGLHREEARQLGGLLADRRHRGRAARAARPPAP